MLQKGNKTFDKKMRNNKIKKALQSNTPINNMYSLIPEKRRGTFVKFASRFGFTEEKIKLLLANEKR